MGFVSAYSASHEGQAFRVLATGSVCIDLAYRGLNAIHRAGLSRLARERVHHPFSGVYWYFDTGGCARAAPTPRPTIPIRTSGSSSSETRVMLRATGSRASARSMRGTPPRSFGARPGGSGVGGHVLDDLLQIRQPSRAPIMALDPVSPPTSRPKEKVRCSSPKPNPPWPRTVSLPLKKNQGPTSTSK